jgi:rhodanese-related sulfurtransferase
MAMKTITAPELAQWLAAAAAPPPLVLDVREPWEVELAGLPGAVSIPMGSITSSLNQLDPDRPTVCLCHHGARSMQVALFLEQQGFSDVSNLTGGIHAWSEQVDATVRTY